ncbi:hypothetical protein M413DRAFT_437882 [Hebeloma cylindrosporum]|uniref:Uncharacterized protein n=1 Tax=Hebeloma cylindrosporum TaxID=76867 RepID=A0A0C3CJ33_HEBCY|nr:hypothetical protein M413DRAFT_437882 [Hebeloma cylindrosporum h7]
MDRICQSTLFLMQAVTSECNRHRRKSQQPHPCQSQAPAHRPNPHATYPNIRLTYRSLS